MPPDDLPHQAAGRVYHRGTNKRKYYMPCSPHRGHIAAFKSPCACASLADCLAVMPFWFFHVAYHMPFRWVSPAIYFCVGLVFRILLGVHPCTQLYTQCAPCVHPCVHPRYHSNIYPHKTKKRAVKGVYPLQRVICSIFELREQDLNLRPSGYEPDELPGCSIPRFYSGHPSECGENIPLAQQRVKTFFEKNAKRCTKITFSPFEPGPANPRRSGFRPRRRSPATRA